MGKKIIFILTSFFSISGQSSPSDSGQYWLDQARIWENTLYRNFSDEYFKKTVEAYGKAGQHFLKESQTNKQAIGPCMLSFRELVEVYLAMENPRAAMNYFLPVFPDIRRLSNKQPNNEDYLKLTKCLYDCAMKTRNEIYHIRYSIAVLETYPKPQTDSIWVNTVRLCISIRDYENLLFILNNVSPPPSQFPSDIKQELKTWWNDQDESDRHVWPGISKQIEKIG